MYQITPRRPPPPTNQVAKWPSVVGRGVGRRPGAGLPDMPENWERVGVKPSLRVQGPEFELPQATLTAYS